MLRVQTIIDREFEDWSELRVQFDALLPTPANNMSCHLIGKPGVSLPKTWDTWVFRGVSQNFPLEPSLSRLFDQGIDPNNAEKKSIEVFQERAHHYFSPLPSPEDNLAWIALMQHHGAPTRLIDWTYSPYIATYFACNDQKDKDGVLYCLNLAELQKVQSKVVNELNNKEPIALRALRPDSRLGVEPLFSQLLFPSREDPVCVRSVTEKLSLVFPVRPSYQSRRMANQQGLLMTSFEPGGMFQGGLLGMSRQADDVLILKYRIPSSQKNAILRHLYASNIHAATLFPEVDGLGRMIADTLLTDGVRLAGRHQKIKYKPIGRDDY